MIDTRIFADPGQKNKLSPLQRQFLKMQIVKIVDRARQRADITQQVIMQFCHNIHRHIS